MLNREKLSEVAHHLEKEGNIWLATVRANNHPHLIPIWFVWADDKVWICTGSSTQKHLNIQHNPHVAVALENGTHPVIIEGEAVEANSPHQRDTLASYFIRKYEWDFRKDKDEDWLLIAITPAKLLSW